MRVNPLLRRSGGQQPPSASVPGLPPTSSSDQPERSGDSSGDPPNQGTPTQPPPPPGGNGSGGGDSNDDRYYRTAREVVRDLFTQETEPLTDFNLPRISDEITDLILDDIELHALFVNEVLREMVYEIGMQVLGTQRARLSMYDKIIQQPHDPDWKTASGRVDWKAVKEGRLPSKQFNWLHEPILVNRRRFVRLEVATKEDVHKAVELEAANIKPALVRLRYHQMIEGALQPGQLVPQRFTNEQLMELYRLAVTQVERERDA